MAIAHYAIVSIYFAPQLLLSSIESSMYITRLTEEYVERKDIWRPSRSCLSEMSSHYTKKYSKEGWNA